MSDTYTEFPALNVNSEQIRHQGYGVVNSGPGDDRLIVGFYRKSIVNVAMSQQQGKRICEDRDFVKIQHPGETYNIVDRAVSEQDKRRFPRQWAMYAQGKQQIPDGIPVSLLFPESPAKTDMLIGYNIHTIEQLANLSGSAIQTVGMGCQEWVNKAQDYLKQAEKGVNYHKFNTEMAAKDQQISTLERQVRELGQRIEQMMSVQSMPAQQQQPRTFDQQSAFINASSQDQERHFAPAPAQFSSTITSPDLSGEVRQRKPRSDRGKARGPRNNPS